MSVYQSKIKLSDLDDSTLSSLKDFIEFLFDLRMVYGNSIIMAAAEVPSASIFSNSRFLYIQRQDLKGTYQDEAMLQDSADSRFNKLLLLMKLGTISSVNADKDVPLERRELKIQLEPDSLDQVYHEIVDRINKKEEQVAQHVKLKNQIIYQDCRVRLGDLSFPVSGWEDAICTVVFSGSDQKTFELATIVLEYTGKMYSKVNTEKYAESVRQAIYRVNTKLAKHFGKKEGLVYSKTSRIVTNNL